MKHHLPPWAKDESCLQNPDKLTPEQVDKIYRLVLPSEVDGRYERVAYSWDKINKVWDGPRGVLGCFPEITYRVPITVPWPPAPSEGPKTAGEAAFIQERKNLYVWAPDDWEEVLTDLGRKHWEAIAQAAIAHHEASKEKEERLAQSPWISTSERMPTREDGDKDGHVFWLYEKGDLSLYLELRKPMSRPWNDPRESTHWMTIPPLPTAAAQKEKPWTPKFKVGDRVRIKADQTNERVDDVLHIKSNGLIHLKYAAELFLPSELEHYVWTPSDSPATPKRVPLEASDVPIGSAIRHVDQPLPVRSIASMDAEGMSVNCRNCYPSFYTWEHMAKYFEIQRPGQDWEPCSKEES